MKRLLLLVAFFALAFSAAASADTLIYVRTDSDSGVTQQQLDAMVPAFQTMVTRDLAPTWGTWATLTTDPALADSAQMEIDLTDYSPVEGALGFHEDYEGIPTSYVFVKESADAHEAWPLVFSHELQEMLVDPWVDRVSQDPFTGRMWAAEISDPVESGYYAYFIDGIPMSDFVEPAWFAPGAPGPFDFMEKLKHAHQVGRHGYAQWFDFARKYWRVVLGYRATHADYSAFETDLPLLSR